MLWFSRLVFIHGVFGFTRLGKYIFAHYCWIFSCFFPWNKLENAPIARRNLNSKLWRVGRFFLFYLISLWNILACEDMVGRVNGLSHFQSRPFKHKSKLSAFDTNQPLVFPNRRPLFQLNCEFGYYTVLYYKTKPDTSWRNQTNHPISESLLWTLIEENHPSPHVNGYRTCFWWNCTRTSYYIVG